MTPRTPRGTRRVDFGPLLQQLADKVRASEHHGGTSVWSAAGEARDAGVPIDQAMKVLLPAYVEREPERELKGKQTRVGAEQIRKAYEQEAGDEPKRDFAAEVVKERLRLAVEDPVGELGALHPLLDTAAAAERLEELTAPEPPFVVQTMVEFVASHADVDLDWVIEGIAARGIISLIAGPMKGGKTTLLENALRLVRGTDDEFLGRWAVAPDLPVLYLTEEGAVTIRLNMAHLDIYVVSRRDKVPSQWTLAETVGVAHGWLADHPGGLIVVDTYDKWAGIENENDSAQNVSAIGTFYPLVEAGAAVLLVHHSRKGSGEYGEGIRGSGAILGAVDHAVELKFTNPGDTRRWFEVHGRVLDNVKRMLDFDVETLTYRLVDEAAEQNASLLEQVDGIPHESDDPEGMTASDLAAHWSMKEPRKRIDALVKAGLLKRSPTLVKDGRGKSWRYWRGDPEVNRGTAVQLPYPAVSTAVPELGSVTGGTAAESGTHAHRTGVPTSQGIGSTSVVGPPKVVGDTEKEAS